MENPNSAAQNYANHRRFVPLFHAVTAVFVVFALVASLVALAKAWGMSGFPWTQAALVSLIAGTSLIYWYSRSFAATVQDRTIRAEENLRHYILTGKLLDPRLTMAQIIAVRFASDEEFLSLIDRAISENLSNDQIKRAIKNWRADHHRI